MTDLASFSVFIKGKGSHAAFVPNEFGFNSRPKDSRISKNINGAGSFFCIFFLKRAHPTVV